jgi:death on curing protein
MADVEYLGLADFFIIASEVLGIDPTLLARASNLHLADSALHAPSAGFGNVEFHPDFVTKVGVLGYHLVRNHPLPDGDKRTAFLAMIEFTERNGWLWKDLPTTGLVKRAAAAAVEETTINVMIGAAAGTLNEDSFVGWVAQRVRPGR